MQRSRPQGTTVETRRPSGLVRARCRVTAGGWPDIGKLLLQRPESKYLTLRRSHRLCLVFFPFYLTALQGRENILTLQAVQKAGLALQAWLACSQSDLLSRLETVFRVCLKKENMGPSVERLLRISRRETKGRPCAHRAAGPAALVLTPCSGTWHQPWGHPLPSGG